MHLYICPQCPSPLVHSKILKKADCIILVAANEVYIEQRVHWVYQDFFSNLAEVAKFFGAFLFYRQLGGPIEKGVPNLRPIFFFSLLLLTNVINYSARAFRSFSLLFIY